jgi:hypothetical protein
VIGASLGGSSFFAARRVSGDPFAAELPDAHDRDTHEHSQRADRTQKLFFDFLKAFGELTVPNRQKFGHELRVVHLQREGTRKDSRVGHGLAGAAG